MSNRAPKVDAATWLMVIVSLVAILLVVYVLLSNLYSTAQRNMTQGATDNTQLIMSTAENLKPIGVSAVAGAAAPKATAARSGKEIYTASCFACHGTGAAGAPKLEKGAWETRASTGLDALMKTALNGKGAMPARGGNPALTDAEIKATVLYMTKEAGFDLGGEIAPAAKNVEKKIEKVVIPKTAAAPVVAAKSSVDGEAVYKNACFACHDFGAAGAPKLEKAAWESRVAAGLDVMMNTALNGKGSMPARGGNAALTDAEVRAAVLHMTKTAGFDLGGATAPAAKKAEKVVTPKAVAAPVVAAKSSVDGEAIYKNACFACHDYGAAGAPKLEKAAWESRVAAGLDTMMDAALNGKGSMPARGGNAALTDAEVKAAVLHMTKTAGFDLGATAAPAAMEKAVAPTKPAVPAAPVAATTPTAPTVPATPVLAAKSSEDGEKVYKTACFACHDYGAAGSPKTGDKAVWAPRIATGIDSLYSVALNGKGSMPPKGGNMALSDAKVKAAVDYMVEQSK